MASPVAIPLMEGATPQSANGGDESQSIHQKGRDKVPWPKEVWDAMDLHVHEEIMRTSVGGKFLPLHKVHPKTTTIPGDTVTLPQAQSSGAPSGTPNPLTVDEGAFIRINESWTEFALTAQQVQEAGEAKELAHTTAVTLATRAANFLSRAQDMVIFQGFNAYYTPFFQTYVRWRPQQMPADTGLLCLPAGENPAGTLPPITIASVVLPSPAQVVQVPKNTNTVDSPFVTYGENTFGAISKAYSALQNSGADGPYACVLFTNAYADTYAPLPSTLIVTADRIKPLMDAGYYGSGSMAFGFADTATPSATASYSGLVVSLGGNSMDLVVGHPATVAFTQENPDGSFLFRILQRFALRLKDTSSVIRLEFQ
jgi:uncharacterized linocin/CFP29 family protein